MGRSVLVIANPAAGFRRDGSLAERAVRMLKSRGMRTELYCTTRPGDAQRAAHDARGAFDLVVAAGGDGTIHEIANGLALTTTALGIVPLGSMNILAREIGVPLDVEGACEWIAGAEPRPVTLGLRQERYFVLMAGIGYDAHALEAALGRAKGKDRKVGLPDYVIAATVGARRYRFPRVVAEADGWSGSGAFAFVANCARYGANLRIARHALLDEPLLDLVVFSSGRLADRLRYFAAVLGGVQATAPGVVYRKVQEVVIRAEGPERVPCQLDGECSDPLPGSFRAVPEALLLLRSSSVA